MPYHILVSGPGHSILNRNREREAAVLTFVAPFVAGDVQYLEGRLIEPSVFGTLAVFYTDSEVNRDSLPHAPYVEPLPETFKDDPLMQVVQTQHEQEAYNQTYIAFLQQHAQNVTSDLYREALDRIENLSYRTSREVTLSQLRQREVFMVCSFSNTEVKHAYDVVIKPLMEKRNLVIKRVDEIATTDEVTHVILEEIRRAQFLIADFTDLKPNCFYEAGYAHAFGKPVVITAKTGTSIQFDLSVHKWNRWSTEDELQQILEREVDAVINRLGIR